MIFSWHTDIFQKWLPDFIPLIMKVSGNLQLQEVNIFLGSANTEQACWRRQEFWRSSTEHLYFVSFVHFYFGLLRVRKENRVRKHSTHLPCLGKILQIIQTTSIPICLCFSTSILTYSWNFQQRARNYLLLLSTARKSCKLRLNSSK